MPTFRPRKSRSTLVTVWSVTAGMRASFVARSSGFSNRPFPHYAPVNKHKEMRTRLGWTVSYKSLYFVHPSLELVPLFTGMRERSILQYPVMFLEKMSNGAAARIESEGCMRILLEAVIWRTLRVH